MKIRKIVLAIVVVLLTILTAVGCGKSKAVENAVKKIEERAAGASQSPEQTVIPTPTPTPKNSDLLIGEWLLEGIGRYEFKEDGTMVIVFRNAEEDVARYTADEHEIRIDRDDAGISVNEYLIQGNTLTMTDKLGTVYTLTRR